VKRSRAAAAILAGLLALAGWPVRAAAPPRLSPRTPVVVGDRQSLGRLALRNLAPEASGALGDGEARGLSAVAVNAVSGLSGLQLASSRLFLSEAVTLSRPSPSLYSRVVELAERYRVSPARPRPAPAWGLTAGPAAERRSWPRLKVPAVRLPAEESRAGSIDLGELEAIRLAGQLVSPRETPSGAGEQPARDEAPAVDLVATVPLVPERVAVSARYRLVDVDRLAGASVNATPQTVGVGGQIALNGGTILSADLNLDRDAVRGSQVRTSFGLGYRLNEDAALRASYTLINFGARPSPAESRRQASAELSLRF
jgi:hypothetical protein